MPPELDAIAESSTATEGTSQQQTTDVATGGESSTTPAQVEGDSKAASSPATAAEPKSSLEAMKQATAILSKANDTRTGEGKAGESPTQEASGTKDAEQPVKTEGAAESDDPAEAERKFQASLKPETAKRFKELTDDLAVAAPKAQHWDQMQAYLLDSGYKDPAELSRGMQVLGLMKRDPLKAIPILEGTLVTLKRIAGVGGELPADIQERIESGLIDEATGKELAAERGKNRFQQQRTEQGQQEADENRRRDALEAHVQTIHAAVTKEQVAWQKSDPDFGKLSRLVEREVVALLTEKGPKVKTVADAQALVKEAIANVKRDAGVIRGPVKEVKPPIGESGSGKNAAAVPKSSFEAMQLKARDMRAGGS